MGQNSGKGRCIPTARPLKPPDPFDTQARFPSILADSNAMDEAEDVDMDGDDREGDGDEQDEEETTKGGDENAPIDISMDQDTSQIPMTSPTTEENTSSTNQENSSQPKESIEHSVNQSDDVLQLSQVAASASAFAPNADTSQDVPMTDSSQPEQSISQVAPAQGMPAIGESSVLEATSDMSTSQPLPKSEAAAIEDVRLPDMDAGPLAEAHAFEEPVAPMHVEVEQPLERPEDSTDALALPVASAIPMPTQARTDSSIQTPDAARPTDAALEAPVEPEAAPGVSTEVEESSKAAEVAPAADMKRSLTPSPSPERIQEFKEHEAVIEPPAVIPGNLPSPSPQPEPSSTAETSAAPSNALEGVVAGSHVADVQLGGGAAGADAGEVALEPVSREPPSQVAEEVTMEGEADPGKSLGEGDPVGVNGQEEFGDEDVRRAEEAPLASDVTSAGEQSAAAGDQTEKAE